MLHVAEFLAVLTVLLAKSPLVITNRISFNPTSFCHPVGNVLHVAFKSHAPPRVKVAGELQIHDISTV